MEAVKCTNVLFLFFYFGLTLHCSQFSIFSSVNAIYFAFTSLPCAFLLYYAKRLVAGLTVGLFFSCKVDPMTHFA